MKPYPQYKDSGIDWLGEVPEAWKVKKMKYISTVNPTKESDFDKTSDEMVTFLPMENVSESGQVCCDNKKSISSLSTGFTYFKKNDVIIAKITPCFENGKGALLNKLDTEIGFGSTEFHVLRAVESSSPAFLFYITRTYQFRTLGEAFMTGAAGQKRVPTDFIEEFFIALPSLSEQTTIAAFLDRKTAEIDSIIAKKERLIELYEEEKAAVINHAVTKGLDPDAKMKDSGIEWLGEIPEHWGISRMKFLSEIKTGDKDTEEKEENGLYPFYVRSQTIEQISTYSFDGEAILTAGDGVGVGKVFHYVNGKFDYHQRVYKISDFKIINGNFLFYYMQDSFYKEVIGISAKSTVDSLRLPMLQNFPVVIPINEQTAIVQHIETKCSHIDAIISKFKRQIELLKEYRTALISEAVTGKIDLRHEI